MSSLMRATIHRGRGAGLGWIVAFALGYAVRDLQEPDSRVRAWAESMAKRLREMFDPKCCQPKTDEGEPEKEEA
jgi:hypothetical protein